MTIPFPIVYEHPVGLTSFDEGKQIHPIEVSMNMTIPPLSTATIVLPKDEVLDRGRYAKMYTPNGDVVFFRIRSPEFDFEAGTVTHELDHAVAEVGDWLVIKNYSGTYNAKTAIERVWGSGNNLNYRGFLWQIDTTNLEQFTEKNVVMDYDHEDILSAMNEIVEAIPGLYMTFDFSTRPWTIGFDVFNADSLSGNLMAYANLSRNVQSATVTYDDTDLCTRVYYNDGTWKSIDAEQEILDKYGIIERVSDENSSVSGRKKYVAEEYLYKNQHPLISIEIDADELSAITGLPNDKFQLGKLIRFYLPEMGETVDRTITGISWDDVYGNPRSATVTCGEEDPKLWSFIRGLRGKKK